jgi:hypothetical protein
MSRLRLVDVGFRGLGLKPESAIISVVPVLHEIIPGGWSRVWLCEADATMGSTSGENP